MSDTVIRVENLTKHFLIGKRSTFISYLLPDILSKRMFYNQSNNNGVYEDTNKIIWALKNVSFEVKKGEVLGIIGENGSGKTTILSLIAGITNPTHGRVVTRGRVGALIQLGAGFHPELTGRENVYLNCAILGLSSKEVDKIYDQIVEFSELEKFMDTPVKRYSSGMYARLGFSVAIHIEPDILLVDEVLSVGDSKFQNKSFEKMMDIKNKSTIIFVSHNLHAVAVICDKVILLNKGLIKEVGDPRSVISNYNKLALYALRDGKTENVRDYNRTITGDIVVYKVEMFDEKMNSKDSYTINESIRFRLYYEAFKHVGKIYFRLDITSFNVGRLVCASMAMDGTVRKNIQTGEGYIDCCFDKIPLQIGHYGVDINIMPENQNGSGKLFRQFLATTFSVVYFSEDKESSGPKSEIGEANMGPVYVPYSWNYSNN